MPYLNESACRLHPPSRYVRFRRSTRRSAGKVYSIIFGIKADGTTEEQAYRYNKSTWTAAQARRHCREHDGRFEPAREGNNMQQLTANLETQFTSRMFDGRGHLVAPVVLMVEGVHTGSSGMPTYYSPEDLMASTHLWNGVPVPVHHPSDEAGPISANQPDVIEESVIGRLFNVWFDNDGNKLRGEIWIDAEKTRQISSELLKAIRDGEHIEVSTGLYSDDNRESGDWNGEHYEVRAINIHPDHLALLPGEIGACSWTDGCGVRANQNQKGDMPVSNNTQQDGGILEKLKGLIKQFTTPPSSKPDCALHLTTHESSHEDIRAQIQAKLDALDNEGWLHFARDIYDDYFIYQAQYRGDNPSETVVAGTPKFYRRGYSVGADDQVTLAESAEEVREVREWVPATMQANKDDNQQLTHKEESDMDKKKLIDGLIANEKSRFDETDRDWLNSLEEDQLWKFTPCANAAEPPAKPSEEKAPEANADDKPKAAPDPKPDPKPEDNKQPVTVAEYIGNAPAEIASYLRRAVASEDQKKQALVTELVANKRCKFTKEELQAKDVGELEQLAELANVSLDFSGRTGAASSAEPEALTMPPTFEKVT